MMMLILVALFGLNLGFGVHSVMTDEAISAAWNLGVAGALLAMIIALAGDQ